MSTLSVVCVDDEYPALELMESYCKQTEGLALQKVFARPDEALAYLESSTIDLLILDIQMPVMNGMELLQQVSSNQLCIFITADPNYAVKAYELNVIDYLVKPVTYERFRKAIQKAIDYKKFTANQNSNSDFILFKSDYMIHQVKADDVLWVEGAGEYLKVITRFKQHMVLQRMNEFEELYRHLGFIRIHKSYLVLKKSIASYNSQTVILKDGKELPIGRAFKSNLE